MTTREIILSKVNSFGAIKAVDLALQVMGEVNPSTFDTDEFHRTLENLVKEGKIIELEYILQRMDYRTKSIFLPEGTKIWANETWKIGQLT